MDIPTQAELIARIEDFCERHGMAESRFGRETVNNPAFVRGLRGGSPPKLDTLIKLQDYMERVEAEAATQAKLHADPPPHAGAGAEEVELPFVRAPVNPTGASSPTCSPTTGRPMPLEASGSCPSCSSSGIGR